MTEDEWIIHAIESKYTDGWYPVGKLEWSEEMPWYHEAPSKMEDWLWVSQQYRDTDKLWYWCVGMPPHGDTYKSKVPLTVPQMLKYLISSPVVAIGRPTEKGTPVMGIPRGVRLKGMKEWIMREEPDKTTEK